MRSYYILIAFIMLQFMFINESYATHNTGCFSEHPTWCGDGVCDAGICFVGCHAGVSADCLGECDAPYYWSGTCHNYKYEDIDGKGYPERCTSTAGSIDDKCGTSTSYQYAYGRDSPSPYCYYSPSYSCASGQNCRIKSNGQPECYDSTPPTTSASATSPPGGSSYTFNTWTKNNVQVSLSCSDTGGSGCSTTKYCTDTSNSCTPATTDTSVTISTEGASYVRYFSTDGAKNTESTQSKVIGIDTAAPSTSASATSPPGGSSYTFNTWTKNNVQVSLSCSDTGGSGCSTTKYCTDTSNSCTPATTGTSVTISTDGTTYVRYMSIDNAGNTESTNSRTVKVDTTSPTCSISSITESSSYAYVSGSTIYYSTASSGSFDVSVSSTDATSDVQKVNFPTTVSTGGVDTTSPYSQTYNWDTGDTFDTSTTATCYDNAGNTNTASFTVNRDVTAPSGGSVSYDNRWYTLASVSIALSKGTDSESGVGDRWLERQLASISGGSCGAFGSWSSIASNPSEPYTDTSVTSGNCYKYRYYVRDNVFNEVPYYTSSNIVKVDTDFPSVYPISPITAVMDLASTFSTTVSDAVSGISSCSFYAPNSPGEVAALQGTMTVTDASGGTCDPGESCTASYTHKFTSTGKYNSVYASCADNAGKIASGTSVTVTVTAPGCKSGECTDPSFKGVYLRKTTGGFGIKSCIVGSTSGWEFATCNSFTPLPYSTDIGVRSSMDNMCPPVSLADGTDCHIRLPCAGNPCWSANSQYNGKWSASDYSCVTCSGSLKTHSLGKGGNYIILAEHTNFGGRDEVITHDDADLTNNYVNEDPPLFKDTDISSVIVTSPCTVVLYDDKNYLGSSLTLTTSNNDLGTVGWNDRAKSIKILGCSTGAITVDCSGTMEDIPDKCEKGCGASTACDEIAPGACIGATKQKCDGSCNAVSTCGDGLTNCGEGCDFNNPSDPEQARCSATCTVVPVGTCTLPKNLGSLILGQSTPATGTESLAHPVNEDVFKVRPTASGYLYVNLDGPGASCDWDFWVGQDACASSTVNLFRSPYTDKSGDSSFCDPSVRSSAKVEANKDYYITVHRNAGDGTGTLTVRLEDCYSNDIVSETRSSQCDIVSGKLGRCIRPPEPSPYTCDYPACASNSECATDNCCGSLTAGGPDGIFANACWSKGTRSTDKTLLCSS